MRLLGDDRGNRPLIKFLRHLGYNATGWKQGRNLGTQGFSEDSLREAMEPLIRAGNGKVALVGHSLGGNATMQMSKYLGDNGVKVSYSVSC